MMIGFLMFAGFCLGIVLGERDARKKRRGWKPHTPSTDILRDYK